MQKSNKETKVLERRDVALILSAVLFGVNFLLFYFIFLHVFAVSGVLRVGLCWVGAYALTWVMTTAVKGSARLILTLIMLGVQYVVSHYGP